MDQQVGLRFFGSAERQFLMCAVQRIASLEGNDAAPAHFTEVCSQFIGCIATATIIIMDWGLDASDRPAEVGISGSIVQVVHSWVGDIIRPKHAFGFRRLIRCPFVGDRQDGEDNPFRVP